MNTVKSYCVMILVAMVACFGALGCAEEPYQEATSDDPVAAAYRAETVSACVRVCEQEVQAHCANTWPTREQDCRPTCEVALAQVQDPCVNQFDAWYECLWYADAHCDGGGVTHGRGCDAQHEQVIACIYSL